MFRKFTLHNFRTHVDSTLELSGLNLVIGDNNSGKSNLFAGIRHFSRLIYQFRPIEHSRPVTLRRASRSPRRRVDVRRYDFFPHRHRLADKKEPMSLSCLWEHEHGRITYTIELYSLDEQVVAAREKLEAYPTDTGGKYECQAGYDRLSTSITLEGDIQRSSADIRVKSLCRKFFRDIRSVHAFHFQPTHLKGLIASPQEAATSENSSEPESRMAFHFTFGIDFPARLGYEGGNLQELLLEAKERGERSFELCTSLLRTFDKSFHGMRRDEGKPIWEFSLGAQAGRLDEFPPHVVSDGLLKAAAIALLVSIRRPPALILIEEIENGINPKNIQGLLGWLWTTAGLEYSTDRGYNIQFIITSHSPSVLREFSQNPENVHVMHLHRFGFKSDVRNLATVLETLHGIGTV